MRSADPAEDRPRRARPAPLEAAGPAAEPPLQDAACARAEAAGAKPTHLRAIGPDDTAGALAPHPEHHEEWNGVTQPRRRTGAAAS